MILLCVVRVYPGQSAWPNRGFVTMTGKSLAAFQENGIVWVILLGAFAGGAAVTLWLAGHLDLWWPMTAGMAGVIALGALAYAILIPIEQTFRLSVENRTLAFIGVNLAVSWGLSIWWGWTLGSWSGIADRADPDLLDAGLVYATGAACLWLTSNSVGQLFNGAIYMMGSLAAGLAAFVAAAIWI
jgi:hypothetical protein